MEYIVNILDNLYSSFEFISSTETLLLTCNDIINFKQKKFFHGDKLIYDKKNKIILDIKESNINKELIVGTLHISNNMIYGLNSRKNPYYLFKPMKKVYPTFMVAINDKKIISKKLSQHILVKYDRWEDKLPHGQLVKILGDVGTPEAEYNRILNYYKINQRKKILNKKYKIKGNTKLFELVNNKELLDYEDNRDLYIVSVDPKNCRDIDDAISYEYKDNQHVIGIHIADVSFWLDKLDLYSYMKDMFFTVYCPHKKFNIFPDVLSDHLFSLKAGQDRLAISIFIYLNDSYKMEKYEIKKSIIKLKKNLTYEKVNKEIQKKNSLLGKLFTISKDITKILGGEKIKIEEKYDSHQMIENYMLLANKLTAEYLIKNNKNPILRVHNEPKYMINLTECPIKNQEVLNFMKYYQMECAIYKNYESETNYNYYHYGLDLQYYTHFTSPIRRYVDIITHLKLKQIIGGENNMLNKMNYNCEKINQQQKIHKKMYRDLECINIINNKIVNKTYESYIIDIKENVLTLYIPEIKCLYRKTLYDKKLFSIMDFKITQNGIYIQNKNTKKELNIQLYTIEKVKLLKKINELDVILEKDIMEIHSI
jgi:exoribonuclease R